MINKQEKQTLKRNNKSRILLWLNRDLATIVKNYNKQFDLNEELRKFFEYKSQDLQINVELTVDSYPEIQNMIKFLNEFNHGLTKLLKHLDSFEDILIKIGTDIFYDDDDDCNNEEDCNECERLSTYLGVFHNRPQEREKIEQENKLDLSLKQDLFYKKIKQIKEFYHLNDTELDQYNKQQLIQYLLTFVNRNKDIVELLHYKDVHNQLGKPYTKASIAKKRYLSKKSSK